MKNYIYMFFTQNNKTYNLSYVYFYDKFNIYLIIFKKPQINPILKIFNPLVAREGGK